MPSSPLVSVIIPAYNASAFIGETLASVCSQTYRNLEILVVDDGSVDQTAEIVRFFSERDPRVTLISQPNQGVASARNHAITHAQGALIAPIDADDIWYPEKVERQVMCLGQAGPSVGLVYTWWVVIDEKGQICTDVRRPTLEGNVFEALIEGNFIGNASVPLIRRHCIEEVGGFNPLVCEDWDFALRIAERYEFRVVPTCLVGYRKITGSRSTDFSGMAESYEWMIASFQQKYPDLPRSTYRQSRVAFYLYLARNSFIDGDHRGALRWIFHAVRTYPPALCTPWVLLTVLISWPAFIASPLVSSLWPNRRTWTRLSRSWTSLKQNLGLKR